MKHNSNRVKTFYGIDYVLLCMAMLLGITAFTRETQTNTSKPTDVAKVHFKLNFSTKGNVKLPEHFNDTLEKVNKLLDMLYSSKEFKDSLYAHSFNDSTFSRVKKPCFKVEINENTHRIDGSNVYGNLIEDPEINLELLVQETLEKTKTQGFSSACKYKITSNDYWMSGGQPLAFRYVRHIAHEFTHQGVSSRQQSGEAL